MAKIATSIILACYNEGPTFEKSVAEIVKVLRSTHRPWEIIFVEDKSDDDTLQKVIKLTRKVNGSRAIYHRRNMGRGKSVSDGIWASRGSVCGYLDVDLEISARYIPIFVREVENDFDMVVGKRLYKANAKSIMRFIASKFYSVLVKTILGLKVDDTESGYKFFNRKKILPILKKTKDHGWFWDTEICARATFAGLRLKQVSVVFKRRTDKKSTVRLIPDALNYLLKIFQFRLNH